MVGTCAVPKCTSTTKFSTEKRCLFSFPKSEEQQLLWKKAIQREDIINTKHHKVCSRHFESHFIITADTFKINGEIVALPRNIWKLSPSAVPTLFLESCCSLSDDAKNGGVVHKRWQATCTGPKRQLTTSSSDDANVMDDAPKSKRLRATEGDLANKSVDKAKESRKQSWPASTPALKRDAMPKVCKKQISPASASTDGAGGPNSKETSPKRLKMQTEAAIGEDVTTSPVKQVSSKSTDNAPLALDKKATVKEPQMHYKRIEIPSVSKSSNAAITSVVSGKRVQPISNAPASSIVQGHNARNSEISDKLGPSSTADNSDVASDAPCSSTILSNLLTKGSAGATLKNKTCPAGSPAIVQMQQEQILRLEAELAVVNKKHAADLRKLCKSEAEKYRYREFCYRTNGSLRRTQRRNGQLALQIKNLKAENRRLQKESALKYDLHGRQKQVLMEALKKAKCHEKLQGVRYSNDWILDCLSLYLHSNFMYDFLRKNEFLPLPNPATMFRHLKPLKSEFGYESSVLGILEDSMTNSDLREKLKKLVFKDVSVQNGKGDGSEQKEDGADKEKGDGEECDGSEQTENGVDETEEQNGRCDGNEGGNSALNYFLREHSYTCKLEL